MAAYKEERFDSAGAKAIAKALAADNDAVVKGGKGGKGKSQPAPRKKSAPRKAR